MVRNVRGGLCVLLLCVGHVAAAATPLVGGTSARLSDRAGTDRDTAVLRFARDPVLFTLEDPRCPATSSLRLRTSSQANELITLPCANWQTSGTGFRYRDDVGAAGGVRRIIYKSGKLQITIKGQGYTALQGPVAHLEARFSVGSERYCGRFQVFSRNELERIAAKGPTVACEPICGDGFVEAPEQCDDSNAAAGDCCSSTCQYETGTCNDGNLCTVDDQCSSGVCVSPLAKPWVNEFDYDDFTGVLDDRDEFIEIAAPAGTDLGGYKIMAIEGNLNGNAQSQGAPCYSDLETGITTGNPYYTVVIPPGTIVGDDTGMGIGYLVVCFANTSTSHESAGECDVVVPAPATGSNLKNGYLVNTNQIDCPDGILVLDPSDNLIDALSYEGTLPDQGLFGHFFQAPSYNVGADQGYVARVSFEKHSSSLARAVSPAEWALSGACTVASPAENPLETTLAGSIGASNATIAVASTNPSYPPFPPMGTIRIENELASYAAVSGNTFTGVSRGVNGTAAASHASGTQVTLVTTCTANSDSPGATNAGQILSCVPGSCGNGTVNAAAGEECDPNAMASGCGPGEGCVASGEIGECSCVPLCGNGAVHAGEQCDPPGNVDDCAGGQPCNSDCSCPPTPQCTSASYSIPESGLDLCIGAPSCGAPNPVELDTATRQTTFELCFRAPDAAGRVGMTLAPETYFSDAEFLPPGATSPFALTQRFCQPAPATGTLFTQASGNSYPATRCLVGDPDKLLRSCVQDADCDGPVPTTGNGICGTRDVDYTSVTDFYGTTLSLGDGTPDAAGAILLVQTLDVQVFFFVDARCTGTGTDPTCVGCDGVTPAPAGRIGVTQSVAMTPSMVLPLINRWSSGSVENLVDEQFNSINDREVSGSGAIGDTVAAGEYELAAANARLNVGTPVGITVQVQFLTKNLWSPTP